MATLVYAKKLLESPLQFVTTQQLSQILDIENQNTLKDVIKRLLDVELLQRVEKGKFVVSHKMPSTFELAQFLYHPSYISLETALSFYGILPQFPMEVTSVTLKKPREKVVDGLLYSYHKVASTLYLGYKKQHGYLIAEKPKALFDYLYFIAKGQKTENYLDELDLDRVSLTKVKYYTRFIRHKPTKKKVVKLVDKLKEYKRASKGAG